MSEDHRPQVLRWMIRGFANSVRHGRTDLNLMNADGTNARVLTDALALRGAPAWSPDGQGVTAGANVKGTPQLFQISLTGTSTPLVPEYSVDPAGSPDGAFLVYSGADIGTIFPVKAATANGGPFPFPRLTLTRGARRLRVLQGGRVLVLMRGDLQHKNLWSNDVKTGTERQLTNLPSEFDLRDFDISSDGREAVLERVQEQSDIVLIDRTLPN